MKELDTLTVPKVGQSTLPKWWRDASGLSQGGVVEVRPMQDGKNSNILTPKPNKRQGAIGLLEQFAQRPVPIRPPGRHRLPFR